MRLALYFLDESIHPKLPLGKDVWLSQHHVGSSREPVGLRMNGTSTLAYI